MRLERRKPSARTGLFNYLAKAWDKKADIWRDVRSDTPTQFGLGDAAAGFKSGMIPGFVNLLFSAGWALKARTDATLAGERKTRDTALLPASIVSFGTSGYMLWQGLEKVGASGLLTGEGMKDHTLPAAAFFAWGIANGCACLKESIQKAYTALNAQLHFGIGSAALAAAAFFGKHGPENPAFSAVSLAIFSAAIVRATNIRGLGERSDDMKVETLGQFADKHITAKRLRGIAHGFSLAMTAYLFFKNPELKELWMVASYGLLAKGCMDYETAKNQSLATDLAAVTKKPAVNPLPA